ncbi:hypothetical protein [Paenibacillus sp. 1P07SE]|uniref:hypothetical protein n=1 Tax=Paenibacillus sp. 1P07SE TaxID=3132209 RepID=UPI0039A6B6C6
MTIDVWRIHIEHDGLEPQSVTVEELRSLGGEVFPISERVAGASGLAVDFRSWYIQWRSLMDPSGTAPEPMTLKVRAKDTFAAQIPWTQLEGAAFGIADNDGGPLSRGGPVRLYVPAGTSDCLHVKQLVALQFDQAALPAGEAAYGFKNVFAPEELRKG